MSNRPSAAAYEKLQKIWYEDALGIALFQPLELWVYRDYVKGYIMNPMFSPPSNSVDVWKNNMLV